MKINHLILALAACLTVNNFLYSQAFSQEIGASFGPVALRSDYGVRGDSESYFGNIGLGVSLMHYINFSFRADCNCYSSNTYFNDHFKIRTELNYHFTNLDHFGEYADQDNENGLKLRSMHGKAKVIEIGPSLEWHLKSITDFDSERFRFSPFISLGVQYVAFSPEATTDLPGTLGASSNTYPKFIAPPGKEDYINTTSGSTYSIVWSAGTRYRLNKVSDLIFDAKWHTYGSDYIDGLNHDYPENKSNDWMFGISFGYIYYINQ